jgi:hypothetical protein
MALAYGTRDKCNTVTLSHSHTKKTKNPKNAKIVTSDKCYSVTLSHCHTNKTEYSKHAKNCICDP